MNFFKIILNNHSGYDRVELIAVNGDANAASMVINQILGTDMSDWTISSITSIEKDEYMEAKGITVPEVSAINIDWDVDDDEILECIDEMPYEKAADLLGIPKNAYASMTTKERHDWILDAIRHNRKTVEEIMELPEKVVIPCNTNIWSIDDITDYISDETGFCFEGYSIAFNMTEEKMLKMLEKIRKEYSAENCTQDWTNTLDDMVTFIEWAITTERQEKKN